MVKGKTTEELVTSGHKKISQLKVCFTRVNYSNFAEEKGRISNNPGEFEVEM